MTAGTRTPLPQGPRPPDPGPGTPAAGPALVDPVSRRPLRPEGPGGRAGGRAHVLTDGAGSRWPVVDGIPWVRTGRERLRAEVLAAVDRGDESAALVALLGDADDWWDGPVPPEADRLEATTVSTLREAVALLGFGRVGDYVLHRWSDPSYLAGLGLLQAHWPGDLPVVELACGTGPYLRELALRGLTDLTGVDVVFAKVWLASRFVAPTARYVVADVAHGWPFDDGTAAPDGDAPDGHAPYGEAADRSTRDGGRVARAVLCLDAFYFLPGKPRLARAARALAGDGGRVLVAHAHNALADPLSAGEPLTPEGYRDLFRGDGGDPLLYADEELTDALLAGRRPRPAPAEELAGTEAVALVAGRPGALAPVDLALPPRGRELRRNPLYSDSGVLCWPSRRYEEEYSPRASAYLPARLPHPLPPDAARRRLLLDLPDAW